MSTILYTTQFGSRLFGTSTPQSDLDIKHVELPAIGRLLLGRGIGNKVSTTNAEGRNGPEDIDVENVPIQRFARDFYEGQTYALEIAFSIDGSHAGQAHYDARGDQVPFDPSLPFCQFVDELKSQFLTSNIRAMMGYVVTQASIYSFKGERLNAAKAAQALLGMAPANISVAKAMLDPAFAAAAEAAREAHPKYFQLATYDGGKQNMEPCFKLLEKTLPFTMSVETARRTVDSNVKRYGKRAEAASADNVDWKATMHAVRIVDEGVRLLREGRIDLPHPPERAAYLLSIRRGEVPLATVTAEIEEKLSDLKSLAEATSLPPISDGLTARFDQWLESWMMRLYGLSAAPEPARSARMSP